MSPILEWAVTSATMPGQTEAGDAYVVEAFDEGMLVAAIDGLGHGEEAAFAARCAVSALREHASMALVGLLRACHEALKSTRGAVVSAASIHASDNTMTWVGVGNVDGVLVRARGSAGPPTVHVLTLSGLVGYQLPNIHATVVNLNRGDTLIFTTDGIRTGFSHEFGLNERPQQIADRICSKQNKGTDDALVLVARYLGKQT